MTRVFIGHSSMEAPLATFFKDWIDREVPDTETFCASTPEDLPPGQEWLNDILEYARNADVCLVLLSPDSIYKHWLYFEAGLTRGANDGNRVVPALYGGLEKTQVPGPLQHPQALIIDNRASFNAFVTRTIGCPDGIDFYQDFHDTAPPEVRRLIQFGLYGGFFGNCAIESHGRESLISEPRQERCLYFPKTSPQGDIVAVRATVVPQITGQVLRWKFGFQLKTRDVPGLADRYFEFHSGIHDNRSSWTIYDDILHPTPFNVPARFEMRLPFRMEMWFAPDKSYVTCIGIDSRGQRSCLKSEHGEDTWRITNPDWTRLVVKAWGDEYGARVDLDTLEIHRSLL